MISWEYLAGMIDADGSIGTYFTKSGRVVRVVIANTNHEFLKELQKQFGGSLSLREKGQKENWKPFGSITWSRIQAGIILKNIFPHLLIKKEQASTALDLLEYRKRPKNERLYYVRKEIGAFGKIKPEVLEIEEGFAKRIYKLNKKGVEPAIAISEAGVAKKRTKKR